MLSSKKFYQLFFFSLLITTSCSKKSYLTSRGTLDAEKVNTVQLLVDSLQAQKIDQSLTGVFAGLHYMENTGELLYGPDVRVMMVEFNPKLADNDQLMSLFSVISEMRSDRGKVYMKLTEERFSLDKMRIYENAVISYDLSERGNKRTLTIEEGVDVGLGFIRYDLNKVEMDLTNGDLEFFYGSRDKTAKLNMKKDILKTD